MNEFGTLLKQILRGLGISQDQVEIVKGKRNGRKCTAIFVYEEQKKEGAKKNEL